jgi:hypothetical protein
MISGFGWVEPAGFEPSWSVSGYAVGAKPVCIVYGIFQLKNISKPFKFHNLAPRPLSLLLFLI